jgi:hypothetical protein
VEIVLVIEYFPIVGIVLANIDHASKRRKIVAMVAIGGFLMLSAIASQDALLIASINHAR